VSAARGGVSHWRERFGEETSITLDRGMSVPCWLKLKRDADVFTALKSRNGMQWTVVERFTMAMSKDYYVGLAVVSVRGDVLNESVFEYVESGPSVKNRWFTPQVELSSGSSKIGYLEAMDDSTIYFENRLGRESMSRASVANIRFQPVPSRWAAFLNQDRTGVLLTRRVYRWRLPQHRRRPGDGELSAAGPGALRCEQRGAGVGVAEAHGIERAFV